MNLCFNQTRSTAHPSEVVLGRVWPPAAGAVHDAQSFADAAKNVSALPELNGLLSDVARALGFDCVTMVHHVDPRVRGKPVVAYSDYPMSFLSKILERKYIADDPVLMAAERTAAPFLWSELSTLITLNSRHREILATASDAGIDQGFTVPINVPGEPPASCSFGLRDGRNMPREALIASLWVAKFGFEQARRILGLSEVHRHRPRLAPREYECLVWVAHGKSDFDMATMLGLSPNTVHGYLKSAMQRYRVKTRQQLLAACLADGQLTYADILNPPP